MRDVVVALRQQWRTMLGCLLGVIAVVVALTIVTTPTYVARARVYLTVTRVADPVLGDIGGVTLLSSADLTTLAEQLDSPIVQDPLAQAVGAPAGTPFEVSATVPEAKAWLDVLAMSSDPQVAARAGNAVGPVLAQVAAQFAPLLAQPSTGVAARTITPAVVPRSPSSPDLRRNLTLAVLIGLAVGGLAVFTRRALDTRVHSSAELAQTTGRPVLAAIPDDPAAAQATLAFEASPHGHHAESIRRLRTNLLFVDVTTTKHSFVLTSPMPGEGKTTTAVNLGRALAEAGSRTLVVDADLRNPSVAKALGLEGAVGLTTVLLGRIPVREAVQPWGESLLHVLPAGPIPPNPTELLGSRRMAEVMRALTADFDFVLVDSPPLVPVVDAVLLQQLTGALVLVVAAERTRRKDLATALGALETVGVEPAGLVLNFEPVTTEGYRYHYYGYGGTRAGRAGGHARVGAAPKRRATRRRA